MLGRPGISLPAAAMAEFGAGHAITPLAGKLVFFPSFLWHGTAPFESTHKRLTVAFDIAPGVS
jgi:hypothetical protein